MAVQIKNGVPLIACGKVAIDPACCSCPPCVKCLCVFHPVPIPPDPPTATYLHVKVNYSNKSPVVCSDCASLATWFALTFKQCGDGNIINALWEYRFPPGSPCGAEYLQAYIAGYTHNYDIRLGGTWDGAAWEIRAVWQWTTTCPTVPTTPVGIPTIIFTGTPPCTIPGLGSGGLTFYWE